MPQKTEPAKGKTFTEEVKVAAKTVRGKVLSLICHSGLLIVTLGVLKVVELQLHWMYGDQKFFDRLPVAWVIQLSDLLILVKFVRDSWLELKK
jgi:hypothetical protein